MAKELIFRCTFIRNNGNLYTQKFRLYGWKTDVTRFDWFNFQEELYAINIPAGIQDIDMDAFRDFTSLKKVVLHDGMETINSLAFEGCTNLEEINIPKTVTVIDHKAFLDCKKLKVKVYAKYLSIAEDAFEDSVEIQYMV